MCGDSCGFDSSCRTGSFLCNGDILRYFLVQMAKVVNDEVEMMVVLIVIRPDS